MKKQADEFWTSDEDPLLRNEFPPSFNDVFEQCLNRFTLAQFGQALVASMAWILDAQQTFISLFTDADSRWHCIDAGMCPSAAVTSACQLPPGSWAYDSLRETSIVSEWGLMCAGPILAGLPASSFFLGCLIGGVILSPLADSFLGRKNTLLLSCLLMSLSALLIALSPNIWVYSTLKFVIGFGRAVIGPCSIVLSTELVGKRWRNWAAATGCFAFGLGFLSLPAIAYINMRSSWRVLYLSTGLSSLVYCFVFYYVVRESPRWLVLRGRTDEAIANLRAMVPAGFVIANEFNFLKEAEQDQSGDDLFSAAKLVVRNGLALTRLLTIMTAGLGAGLVYYGIPFAVGDLPFDPYLSATMNASAELVASLMVLFAVEKIGQKRGLLGFIVMAGVCSLACAFARGTWQLALEVSSLLAASSASGVLLIYSITLFPTCVRNFALTMVRQALVCGGVLAPLVVAEGRGRGPLSYLFFAAVLGICGLFAILLPETSGESFCDTMFDAQQKGASDKLIQPRDSDTATHV